eukprot:jgi/Botrbrau1/15952/Bobra.0260s0013.1
MMIWDDHQGRCIGELMFKNKVQNLVFNLVFPSSCLKQSALSGVKLTNCQLFSSGRLGSTKYTFPLHTTIWLLRFTSPWQPPRSIFVQQRSFYCMLRWDKQDKHQSYHISCIFLNLPANGLLSHWPKTLQFIPA